MFCVFFDGKTWGPYDPLPWGVEIVRDSDNNAIVVPRTRHEHLRLVFDKADKISRRRRFLRSLIGLQ